MSMWKKTITWLGLDPDADYETGADQAYADPALAAGYEDVTPLPADVGAGTVDASVPPPAPIGTASGASGAGDFSAVRSLGPMTGEGSLGDPSHIDDSVPLSNSQLRPVDVAERSDPPMGSVRAVPSSPSSKPQLVAPRSFNDAQEVADRFRGGAPVVLNLQETDAELGRRLIDFCSGLCYGLRGSMQRVGDRVFLLTPAEVQLTPDDHRLMRDSGLIT